MRRLRRGPAIALLAVVSMTVGCSGDTTKKTTTSFKATSGPDCMNHQSKPPSSADRGTTLDIAQRLIMLRYYTAHGLQSFCDNKSASKDDVSWMRLFVAQGADASLVARWLPS